MTHRKAWHGRLAALACGLALVSVAVAQPASATWPLDFQGAAQIRRDSNENWSLRPPPDERFFTKKLRAAGTPYLYVTGVGPAQSSVASTAPAPIHVKCRQGLDEVIEIPGLLPAGALPDPEITLPPRSGAVFELSNSGTVQPSLVRPRVFAAQGTPARTFVLEEYSGDPLRLVATHQGRVASGHPASTTPLLPGTHFLVLGPQASSLTVTLGIDQRLVSPQPAAVFGECNISGPSGYDLAVRGAQYGMTVPVAALDRVAYDRGDAVAGAVVVAFAALLTFGVRRVMKWRLR
ncbi:MAG: hypothetical protein QOF60_1785 [Actinomycetota bacterium]|nr:hypothetical protein [Actinomycetota bacterium]